MTLVMTRSCLMHRAISRHDINSCMFLYQLLDQVKELVAQYATKKAADLDALDKTLESKTFLVGQSLTLADLATFAAVAESLVGRDRWSLLLILGCPFA